MHNPKQVRRVKAHPFSFRLQEEKPAKVDLQEVEVGSGHWGRSHDPWGCHGDFLWIHDAFESGAGSQLAVDIDWMFRIHAMDFRC